MAYFIPAAAFRQVSSDAKYLAEYLEFGKKAPDSLYKTPTQTLKSSLSQFVSSKYKMLVEEVTQIVLIESCLPQMSKIRGAPGYRGFSRGRARAYAANANARKRRQLPVQSRT